MTATPVQHDVRPGAVEQVGYRRAYVFVSFGLLISVAYRSFALGVAAWDLLALVVLGGLMVALERVRHGTLSRRSVLLSLVSVAAALAFAAALATVRR